MGVGLLNEVAGISNGITDPWSAKLGGSRLFSIDIRRICRRRDGLREVSLRYR